MLLLAQLQALERGERLAVLPALLGRPPRRLPQSVAMQHHALAVEGEHDNRPFGRQLTLGRAARLVEGVEVLGRASHQLFRLTLGHFGPGMARQLEQRFVIGPRGGRFGHPTAHLERVTLRRQIQRRIERMETLVTPRPVAHPLDIHRAEGRLQAPVGHAPL